MYYLQSRYYDPAVGRFINADTYASTGQGFLGCNMFAYCNNNPANCVDECGTEPLTIGLAAFGALAAFSLLSAVIASPGFQEASREASKSISNTFENVKQAVKNRTEAYSVYLLKDSEENIRYVGRVRTENFDKRMAYHLKTRGLVIAYSIDGLDSFTARGLEEILMMELHLLNKDNFLNNQIHGISPRNVNGEEYLNSGLDYLLNKAESIILDLFPG